MAEESERNFDTRAEKDITATARYKTMQNILSKSHIFNK